MEDQDANRKRKAVGSETVEELNTTSASHQEVASLQTSDGATIDSVTLASAKGYRTARSTLCVDEGAWYFEVVVAHLGDSGHARVGWSTKWGELNAPVGFDRHGYGYCDVAGEKVHRRIRQPYGEAYAAGDVVGCYIHITSAAAALETEGPHDARMLDEGDVRGDADGFAEEGGDQKAVGVMENAVGKKEEAESPRGAVGADDDAGVTNAGDALRDTGDDASALGPNTGIAAGPGGCIAFAKNGVFQGVAYHLSRRDAFSPAASLFTLGKAEPLVKVAFNFGPNFVHPAEFGHLPSPKPMCEHVSATEAAKLTSRQHDMTWASEEKCGGEGDAVS
mmetsp:Transcript_2977/g.4752  ORF Transcript_2977/g.4752 Transcript_2977/m.4752 type:complete len:335 (-) Transcript_2977:810-1814(-)